MILDEVISYVTCRLLFVLSLRCLIGVKSLNSDIVTILSQKRNSMKQLQHDCLWCISGCYAHLLLNFLCFSAFCLLVKGTEEVVSTQYWYMGFSSYALKVAIFSSIHSNNKIVKTVQDLSENDEHPKRFSHHSGLVYLYEKCKNTIHGHHHGVSSERSESCTYVLSRGGG